MNTDNSRTKRTLALAAGLACVLWPLTAAADGGGSDTGAFQRALGQGTAVALGASYVFGLATSLTPCVYPMIAITVSIFGARQAQSRAHGALLSLVFVLGIVGLFTPLGVVSALTGRGFGSLLGNPWVVGALAVVFMSLAASLFGAFEIALPQGLQNRLSSVGGTGYRGAFVLGLMCAVVAAPCVGPFLFGLLGWIATTRNVAVGSAAMALYGLGLGTLFFVVGTFAVNLPKAGAWMMGIKWVGGVVLAYLALAYVRDALPAGTLNGVAHPGAVVGVVGALIFAVGLALGGVHLAAERRRSTLARFSAPARIASTVPAVLGAFLVLSWALHPASAAGVDAGASAAAPVRWEADETSAVARARAEHKPLMLDFGAAWCAACNELDHKTFPDPRVREQASRFVALHVDATNDDDPAVTQVREKYGATAGLPVVLLFGSDGKEAVRFTEFVAPDRFAQALASVR